jgi:hypothetical protein
LGQPELRNSNRRQLSIFDTALLFAELQRIAQVQAWKTRDAIAMLTNPVPLIEWNVEKALSRNRVTPRTDDPIERTDCRAFYW